MRPAITFLNIQLSNSRAINKSFNLTTISSLFSMHSPFYFQKKGINIMEVCGTFPSLTVEKQKNGCKASKINACSRFLFRNDMCYCAIFFTLW